MLVFYYFSDRDMKKLIKTMELPQYRHRVRLASVNKENVEVMGFERSAAITIDGLEIWGYLKGPNK